MTARWLGRWPRQAEDRAAWACRGDCSPVRLLCLAGRAAGPDLVGLRVPLDPDVLTAAGPVIPRFAGPAESVRPDVEVRAPQHRLGRARVGTRGRLTDVVEFPRVPWPAPGAGQQDH